MAYNNIRLEKDQVITYNNTLIMGIVKCKTLYYSVLCRIIFEKTTDCSLISFMMPLNVSG